MKIKQTIPYPTYTTTQRNNLTLNVDYVENYIIYNNTESQYEYFDGSNWQPYAMNVIDNEMLYFDATVGVGGDYPCNDATDDLSAAIADGHRIFKVLSNITIYADIEVNYLYLFANKKTNGENYTITSNYRIYNSGTKIYTFAYNLDFDFSYTNATLPIFGKNTNSGRLFFENCEILLSATSSQILCSNSKITGNYITIDVDERSDRFATIENANYITIAGGAMTDNGNGNIVLYGSINNLSITGTWVQNISQGKGMVTIVGVINNISADGSYLWMKYGGSVHNGTAKGVILKDSSGKISRLKDLTCTSWLGTYWTSGNNVLVENCTFSFIRRLSGRLITIKKMTNVTFTDNVSIGAGDVVDSEICNCKFQGNLTIDGDCRIITNNNIEGSTTLSLGSEKNIIAENYFDGGFTNNSGETNNIIKNNIT